MTTKRKPITRHLVPDVSNTARWAMADKVLYPQPEEVNHLELTYQPGLDFPTVYFDKCKVVWNSAKETILKDWIAKFPGTRPSYWWHFDAPRMSEAEAIKHDWQGWYFVPQLCETRRRLGGIGTPSYEVLFYVPVFHCGVPESWITKSDVKYYTYQTDDPGTPADKRSELIRGVVFKGVAVDLADPPTYESQAMYLKRHGLMKDSEVKRVKPEAWNPEVIRAIERPAKAPVVSIKPWLDKSGRIQ